MSSLSQFSSGGKIKSIQRGVITLPTPFNNNTPGYVTETATVSPVNTSKSILSALGQQNGHTYRSLGSNNGASSALLASLELTNSTTITAKSGYHYGNYLVTGATLSETIPPKISWQLVEYE